MPPRSFRRGLQDLKGSAIENMARRAKEGKTNYFQTQAVPLTAPNEVTVEQSLENEARKIAVAWSTAYAGDAPLAFYEIWRDGSKVKEQPFMPQLTTEPLTWSETLSDSLPHTYTVKVTDTRGRIAESTAVALEKA